MTLCYTPTWKIPLRVLMRTDIFTAVFRAISCCCLFYFFLLLFNYPTASFGPSEHLAVFEPGAFRFWLQRLNKLNHSFPDWGSPCRKWWWVFYNVCFYSVWGSRCRKWWRFFYNVYICFLYDFYFYFIYLFFNIMYIQRSIVFHCSKVKLRIKRSVSRFSNVKKWNKMSQIEISKNSFLRNKTKLIINC